MKSTASSRRECKVEPWGMENFSTCVAKLGRKIALIRFEEAGNGALCKPPENGMRISNDVNKDKIIIGARQLPKSLLFFRPSSSG